MIADGKVAREKVRDWDFAGSEISHHFWLYTGTRPWKLSVLVITLDEPGHCALAVNDAAYLARDPRPLVRWIVRHVEAAEMERGVGLAVVPISISRILAFL